MTNAILLLDSLAATLTVLIRSQQLLQKAAAEGRDVTDEELTAARAETDALKKQWDELTG